MSTTITEKQVRHVAALARLALTDAEVERMRAELDAILGFMKTLEELDTEGVPPTTHSIDMVAPLRADVPGASLRRDDVLRAAAKSEAGAFAVPKVLEGE